MTGSREEGGGNQSVSHLHRADVEQHIVEGVAHLDRHLDRQTSTILSAVTVSVSQQVRV